MGRCCSGELCAARQPCGPEAHCPAPPPSPARYASTRRASQSGAGSRLPRRALLAALALKLVIQPVLLTGGVVAALALRLFEPPDPMFLLSMMLSNATPAAINMQARRGVVASAFTGWHAPHPTNPSATPCPAISSPHLPHHPLSHHHRPPLLPRPAPAPPQTLCVMFGYGEAEMSRMLQWQYLAAALTLPCWMWVFLRVIAAWAPS